MPADSAPEPVSLLAEAEVSMHTKPQERSLAIRQMLVFVGVAATIACLLDVSIYRIFLSYPGHDQAWLLYAADRMVHGTRLYGPQLIETNPPLIVWFCALPDLLAITFHASPVLLFKEVLCALVFLSTAWVVRILRAATIVCGVVLTCFAAALILAIESSCTELSDFGQREQILFLLVLPFIVAASSQVSSKLHPVERICLGIAGGVAVCFKPQQGLIVVGLELVLWWWYRDTRQLRRLELIALVLTLLVYLALIQLAAPLYLYRIVPLLRDTYLSYGYIGTTTLIKGLLPFAFCWFATFFVWLRKRSELRVPAAPVGVLVCSFCASIAYCLQHKGFSYQPIPQNGLLLVAVAWILIEAVASLGMQRLQGRYATIFAAVAVLGMAFVLPILSQGRRNMALSKPKSYPQTVLSRYPPGTPVYVFSTSLVGFQDVYQDHLFWVSRYAHLWLLPSIVLNQMAPAGGLPVVKRLPASLVQKLANVQSEDVAEDLHLWKPAVVLIERCTPIHGCQALNLPSFDTLAWFSHSQAFSAEWKHYKWQQGNGRYDVYTRMGEVAD